MMKKISHLLYGSQPCHRVRPAYELSPRPISEDTAPCRHHPVPTIMHSNSFNGSHIKARLRVAAAHNQGLLSLSESFLIYSILHPQGLEEEEFPKKAIRVDDKRVLSKGLMPSSMRLL